jgi:putative membrane protein
MKKLNLIIGGCLSVAMLQACHSGNKAAGGDTTTVTTVTKDSSKTDTTKMVTAVDTVDTKFAMNAAAGGMTEIALSKLAMNQTMNSKIKDFANMMVTDHTDAGNKLSAIAQQEKIILPTGPDSAQQKKIDELTGKSGSDLTKTYVNDMVMDHEKTIMLFENEQKMGKDSSLKAFATATLPTIHKHLDAIMAIKKGM